MKEILDDLRASMQRTEAHRQALLAYDKETVELYERQFAGEVFRITRWMSERRLLGPKDFNRLNYPKTASSLPAIRDWLWGTGHRLQGLEE